LAGDKNFYLMLTFQTLSILNRNLRKTKKNLHPWLQQFFLIGVRRVSHPRVKIKIILSLLILKYDEL
jgi:hypothetical protein